MKVGGGTRHSEKACTTTTFLFSQICKSLFAKLQMRPTISLYVYYIIYIWQWREVLVIPKRHARRQHSYSRGFLSLFFKKILRSLSLCIFTAYMRLGGGATVISRRCHREGAKTTLFSLLMCWFEASDHIYGEIFADAYVSFAKETRRHVGFLCKKNVWFILYAFCTKEALCSPFRRDTLVFKGQYPWQFALTMLLPKFPKSSNSNFSVSRGTNWDFILILNCWGTWDSRCGGFRGCSVFSEHCHIHQVNTSIYTSKDSICLWDTQKGLCQRLSWICCVVRLVYIVPFLFWYASCVTRGPTL